MNSTLPKARADKIVGARPAFARKPKPKPDVGKPLNIDAKKLHDLGGRDFKAFVEAAQRECGLDEGDVGWALEETARRTAGTRPTEDQVVGTFIEVVAAVAPLTVNVRRGMFFACLNLQVRDMIAGEIAFFSNAAIGTSNQLDIVKAEKGFALTLDKLPLSQKEKAMITKLIPHAGMSEGTRNQTIHSVTTAIVRLLEPKLVHARDTTIGGLKFVDRAVLLPLADGQIILVMSEEYKAPKSGGGGVQSSLRINRIFNTDIKPGTEFTYTVTSNHDIATRRSKPPETEVEVRTTMGKVILSASTRGTDQLLVKTSGTGRNETQIASQSRNQKLVDAKRGKGESLRRGKTIDVTFYKQFISLPGRELRNLLKRIRQYRS